MTHEFVGQATKHLYIKVTKKQFIQIVNYSRRNQIPGNELELNMILEALKTDTTDNQTKPIPNRDPALNISAWVPK